MEDDTFKRIPAGQTVHLQIKAEQKEIIQNVLERKYSMAECYQRASERACVTSPLLAPIMQCVTVIIQLVSRDDVCRFKNGSQMAE
jgi:hypothetical protein